MKFEIFRQRLLDELYQKTPALTGVAFFVEGLGIKALEQIDQYIKQIENQVIKPELINDIDKYLPALRERLVDLNKHYIAISQFDYYVKEINKQYNCPHEKIDYLYKDFGKCLMCECFLKIRNEK